MKKFTLILTAIAAFVTINLSDCGLPVLRTEDPSSAKFSEAMKMIEENYVGDFNREQLVDGAIRGMVDALEDRWSYYLSSEELEKYQMMSNNQYTGIGIVIERSANEDGIRVLTVHNNSPAMNSGITPGSLITAVDEVDIVNMTLSEASALIAERINSGELTLHMLDAQGNSYIATLIPSIIEVDPVKYQLLSDNTGYIAIENFEAKTAQQVKNAIDEFIEIGVNGIVFDVRNNPGGQLSELMAILDYILPEGVIFQSKSKGEDTQYRYSDANCIDIPMSVLINSNSYSAAEFFAAALQEYEWATIIGEQSTGKGYAQITLRISDGSAIHISAREYFTPNGISLADIGITPDIIVPLDEDDFLSLYYGTLKHEDDEQLRAAINALYAEESPV